MPSGVRSKFQSFREHWAFRYGIAVVFCVATIGLSVALRRLGISINLTIPVVLAVVLSAWYGGLGPGILTSVVFQITTIMYATRPTDISPATLAFGHFSVFSLYIFLIVSVNRLKAAQMRLSAQRDLLDITLRSIGDGVIATDPRGRVTFVNATAEQLTGWNSDEAVGKQANEILRLVDETTNKEIICPLGEVLDDTTRSSTLRAVSIARGGRRVPVDASTTPIRSGDRVEGAVVVLSDLTEQRAIERARRKTETMRTIVSAQEAERHRIARDLHDNLGQRMSALRLSIEALPRDDAGGSSDLVREVQTAAAHIDRDLGFLAWELTPTELETLGLMDALSSFVREWSAQHSIEAEFHADLSTNGAANNHFSAEIETNLYRIAQEALNNVQKHARATFVSVLLQKRGDRLVLAIEDNGVGFDRDIARFDSSEPPVVHGLSGMKERAALLGGSLEIDSTPGGGTTVMAKLPVTSEHADVDKTSSEVSALSELETSVAPERDASEQPAVKVAG